MIYVGIDVAKDKHDCFIMNSEGEVLFKPFVIRNTSFQVFGKMNGSYTEGSKGKWIF